jgi:F-type H+-transporting ATPase subunit a
VNNLSIGERLTEAISPQTKFVINLFGITIPVTDTVIIMWIVMAFLIIFSIIITRRMQAVPEGKQNIAESIVSFVNSFTEGIIGHNWKLFAPYIGTVGLFLIFSNGISLFNILPNWEQLYELTHIELFRHLPVLEIKPPTKDINVTFAFAFMSMAAVIIGGIRVKKFSGWLGTFIKPMPVMLPFKIFDYLIRPTSLSLRLFGNILGAFIIMELLYIGLPPALPAVMSIYFDLFDGILQAYVFCFLTSFYIAEIVE